MRVNVIDVLKIADIDSSEVSKEFIEFLNNEITPSYQDNELKEHIYNASSIIDNQMEAEHPCEFMDYLELIQTACYVNECGYFRMTY